MNIDFGMKYKSDNEDSVSIIFYTPKIANLLVYNIQFFNEKEDTVVKGSSNSIAVNIVCGEIPIVLDYPKDNSLSFNKVGFYVKDNTLNMKFKVEIKYDDILPSIEPIREDYQNGNI